MRARELIDVVSIHSLTAPWSIARGPEGHVILRRCARGGEQHATCLGRTVYNRYKSHGQAEKSLQDQGRLAFLDPPDLEELYGLGGKGRIYSDLASSYKILHFFTQVGKAALISFRRMLCIPSCSSA